MKNTILQILNCFYGADDQSKFKEQAEYNEKVADAIVENLKQQENKKDGEVMLPFSEIESFYDFVNNNFVKYLGRYERIDNPEKGNWALKDVYEKYKEWKTKGNDRKERV